MRVSRKNVKTGAALFLLGMMNTVASEVQAPSLELLEYLGQYHSDGDEWVDPLEVEAMAQVSFTSESKAGNIEVGGVSVNKTVPEKENP